MAEDYSTYTFKLGKAEDRIYKGTRAPITKGQEFAFEILDKFKMMAISFVADAQDEIKMCNGEITEKVKKSLELKFVLAICTGTDLELIRSYGASIVGNQYSPIIATEDNSSKSFPLSNESQFDAWFGKYPQDLIQFYGFAIWYTVKPFIPSFMDTLEAVGPMEEQTDPLQKQTI